MNDKINLELGCGRENKEGFIGIDCVDFGFNKIADLEKDPLPFADNTVDFIHSQHFFEHLHDVKNCLNECWRVLKSEGTMEVIVPYGLWAGASKPCHHQLITECWFDWLRREDLFERYGFHTWIIEKMDLHQNEQGQTFEITCILKPKKYDEN